MWIDGCKSKELQTAILHLSPKKSQYASPVLIHCFASEKLRNSDQ